ncbi:MAG: YtxH domain-containing protein [Saprospiraceae bacterium]|nr:YtxH domain-containing protein [Saprospiraceae bacterium]
MTTGRIILSIAAGVAAGAILGVLFAPNKGVDTRKKIVQKKDDAVDSLNEMIDRVTGKLEDVKKQAARMVTNGMAKV